MINSLRRYPSPYHTPDSCSDSADSARPSPPRSPQLRSQPDFVARLVSTVKERGALPGATGLPSDQPGNRDAFVKARVDAARNQFVALNMPMSKDAYVRFAVEVSLAELPLHLQRLEPARKKAVQLAEQSWDKEAENLAGRWNNSDAHQRTINASIQEWERAQEPSSSVVRQPGAESRAAALRSAFKSRTTSNE